MQTLPALDPAKRHALVVRPFSMAPAPIMLATFLVGLFYSLDALYGERRDRSILFWKSLPVSDRTTVLSKASIPLVVLPLDRLRAQRGHGGHHAAPEHRRSCWRTA